MIELIFLSVTSLLLGIVSLCFTFYRIGYEQGLKK